MVSPIRCSNREAAKVRLVLGVDRVSLFLQSRSPCGRCSSRRGWFVCALSTLMVRLHFQREAVPLSLLQVHLARGHHVVGVVQAARGCFGGRSSRILLMAELLDEIRLSRPAGRRLPPDCYLSPVGSQVAPHSLDTRNAPTTRGRAAAVALWGTCPSSFVRVPEILTTSIPETLAT